MAQIVYPVRVIKALGTPKLILTNSCGGLNPNFKPGDFMLITDHINFMGANPLTGPNEDWLGCRFPDMTKAYNQELADATSNGYLLQFLNRNYYRASDCENEYFIRSVKKAVRMIQKNLLRLRQEERMEGREFQGISCTPVY